MRGRAEPPPQSGRANPPGFERIRYVGVDGELSWFLGAPPALVAQSRPHGLKVLALSGGGAGGAFGAGALVGLTKAGKRPEFNLVTGVSTGALLAPFAFVGSAWDAQLEEAFTGGYASELLGLRAVRPGPGLYPSEQLSTLVRRYLDEPLVTAVAEAHRAGRRLFVATANLDAQTTSIWDMGAIASSGRDDALELFADVLIASASLPGIFPPKLIRVEQEGQVFEEMHIDGGAITPLFVAPEALLARRATGWDGAAVEIYALFNTTLAPSPRTTPMRVVPILVRSFELMLASSYRTALRSVAAFCEINDFSLNTASVPAELAGASMLRFDRTAMTRMFTLGRSRATEQTLWEPYGG